MNTDIRATCPDCDGTVGEMEKQQVEQEVTATLTCADCETEWTRVLRA
jgi:hypothetical protein